MWLAAGRTLERVAALGKTHDVTFVLENLNLEVDHPGTPFARARDTMALVADVGSPHLRMNLDLYHAQIGEGNLAELIRRSAPYVGEVQVADVPGRCEPTTGEIRWDFLAQVLADVGYDGVVALEAFASEPGPAGSDLALARFPGGIHGLTARQAGARHDEDFDGRRVDGVLAEDRGTWATSGAGSDR